MLTVKQISALKPRGSRYSIQADSLLYVEVLPTGKKTWFIKTMNKGKVIKRKLGDYPALSFFYARSKRDEILQLIKEPLINVHKTSSACDLQIKNLKV